jgi:hypothetical protein
MPLDGGKKGVVGKSSRSIWCVSACAIGRVVVSYSPHRLKADI